MQKIGCVVLNYNDYSTTKKFIEKVLTINSIDLIVVVDNNSTDDSVKELMGIQSEKVLLIPNSENKGYGAGNNIGIKYLQSKGFRFVIVANPDVVFTEKAIKVVIEHLLHFDDSALASVVPVNAIGEYMYPVAWKPISKGMEILSTGVLLSHLLKNKSYYNYYELIKINTDFVSVDAIPGSLLVFDLNKVIPIFDENVFLFYEEKIISSILRKKGYKTDIIVSQTYIHDHSTTIKKAMNEYKKNKIALKSKLYYLKNYCELNTFEIFLTEIMVVIAKIEYFFVFIIKSIFNL